MLLQDELNDALDREKSERKIHTFLKQYPLLVWATFKTCSGNSDYVMTEFPLSGKHRTDFVVMQSFSISCNIALIEFEPVDENPYKDILSLEPC